MRTMILNGLELAWSHSPNLTFGQLVESVENLAWELYEQQEKRHFSARLGNLPDWAVLSALVQWDKPAVREIYKYKP